MLDVRTFTLALDDALGAVAEARGYEDGKAAGSWVTDGNTTRETYARLLCGIEDGDPIVMDELPVPRLGGEWADDPTLEDVTLDCLYAIGVDDGGIDTDEDGIQRGYFEDSVYDAYGLGHAQGVEDEIVRACRHQLADAE